MADKEFFKWVGGPEDIVHPGVNRLELGVLFEGVKGHIASTGDKDKIKFFKESERFEDSSKEEAEESGFVELEGVVSDGESGGSTPGGTTTVTSGANRTSTR